MFKFLTVFLGLLTFPICSHAIYIDSVTFDIPTDQDFIGKQVLNNTHSTQMYTISAISIDRPGDLEKRSRINNGEILYSPLKFNLQPGSFEYFKIFYRGPKDDKERYYRILFSEVPMEMLEYSESKRKTQILPEISLSTILVVRPRKMKLDYKYDELQGQLINTGNTYFRVLIHQGCHSTDEEAFNVYLLPGQVLTKNSLKGQNKKFIIANERYFRLGEQCFK